jgi:hypothetical protein
VITLTGNTLPSAPDVDHHAVGGCGDVHAAELASDRLVNLLADIFHAGWGRENLKTFAKQPHLLSGLLICWRSRAASPADRSLKAVLLLGEQRPLFNIAPQPPEAQVDVPNIFATPAARPDGR